MTILPANLINAVPYDQIIAKSENDLRKALIILEDMVITQQFNQPQQLAYEKAIAQIAQKITGGALDPKTILECRGVFYALLASTMHPHFIIEKVCQEICRIAPTMAPTVWYIASHYDIGASKSNKEIFALEAFAARVLDTFGKVRSMPNA